MLFTQSSPSQSLKYPDSVHPVAIPGRAQLTGGSGVQSLGGSEQRSDITGLLSEQDPGHKGARVEARKPERRQLQ